MQKSLLRHVISRIPIVRYLGPRSAPPDQASPPTRESVETAARIERRLEAAEGFVAAVNETARRIEQRLYLLEGSVRTSHIANIVRLIDFELEGHPRYADPRRLLRYAAQVCSQNGEDGMIREIFRRIGTCDRIFVEVGVQDGHESNTSFLLSQGWTGYWFDASDSFVKTLTRPDLDDGGVKSRVSFITRENIASLFDGIGVPAEFDLLSIDIDQNTYYAWDGLSNYRPRVVVVEYNSSLPPDVDWKVRYDPGRTWDGTNNFGASLKAFELLGRDYGYSLVGCDFIGVNAFFVRDDLVGDSFAEPFTAANHYEPPRYHLSHRRCHPRQLLDKAHTNKPPRQEDEQ